MIFIAGGECFIEFKPRQDADVSLISGKLRLHDDVSNQDCDVAVRNIDSQLSVFHPNAAGENRFIYFIKFLSFAM